MNDRSEAPVADPHRLGSQGATPVVHSELDEWMHDFRNALGTILIAADAARISVPDQRNFEFSVAMGRVEDGCNLCLKLLRAMPAA